MLKKNILIGFLIVVIVGMAGYITYDKVFSKEVKRNDKATDSSKESTEKEGKPTFDFQISYQDELYETNNSNGVKVTSSKRNLPIITSKQYPTAASNIVDSLTQYSNERWNEVKKMADDSKEYPVAAGNTIGVNYMISTVLSNVNVVSFRFLMSGAFGGVSWDEEHGYNYVTSTGNILEFRHLTDQYENLTNTCYDYAVNMISSSVASSLYQDDVNGKWQDILKEKMFELGNWYFTENGIYFSIEKYALGPGSAGVIHVEVPYQNINQYLKKEYQG